MKHIGVFFITAVLCILILCLSLIFPQQAIRTNIEESLTQFDSEGNYPLVFDKTADANMLDNTTDALMLMQSYYSSDWESLWKNSWNRSEEGMVSALNDTILEDAPANYTYSRYWAGCRATLRLLLSFLNYMEIRHIVAVFFYTLFILAGMLIYKHGDILYAMAFSLSIILIRPEVVSNTLQYSACYLIAFLAMCFVPYVIRKNWSVCAMFIVIGCITQFFDYYTTPLVTFAYPFITVLIIKKSGDSKENNKLFLKSICSWFVSWLSMWIVKLSLTSFFTNENAFAKAIGSVSGRLGFKQIEGVEDSYNPLKAIVVVFRTLLQSPKMMAVICFVLILFVTTAMYIYKPKISFLRKNWKRSVVYILIALLPIVWFVCTCSPTVLHAFFQYRSLSVFIIAGLFWILELMRPSGIDSAIS